MTRFFRESRPTPSRRSRVKHCSRIRNSAPESRLVKQVNCWADAEFHTSLAEQWTNRYSMSTTVLSLTNCHSLCSLCSLFFIFYLIFFLLLLSCEFRFVLPPSIQRQMILSGKKKEKLTCSRARRVITWLTATPSAENVTETIAYREAQ